MSVLLFVVRSRLQSFLSIQESNLWGDLRGQYIIIDIMFFKMWSKNEEFPSS